MWRRNCQQPPLRLRDTHACFLRPCFRRFCRRLWAENPVSEVSSVYLLRERKPVCTTYCGLLMRFCVVIDVANRISRRAGSLKIILNDTSALKLLCCNMFFSGKASWVIFCRRWRHWRWGFDLEKYGCEYFPMFQATPGPGFWCRICKNRSHQRRRWQIRGFKKSRLCDKGNVLYCKFISTIKIAGNRLGW